MGLRYEILKTFNFEAAHRLMGMEAGHQCARIHGHSYKVDIGLSSGVLDDRGMVEDFAVLSQAVKPLIADLDHRLMLSREDPLARADDRDIRVLPCNPTSENLAKMFWEALVDKLASGGEYPGDPVSREAIRLESVCVWETATSRSLIQRDWKLSSP
jgi:6-pyruvoyltetrahydropterin/6-carboxytetrahydropterin synthase